MFRRHWLAAVLSLLSCTTAAAQTPPSVDYTRDVRPILAAHCFGCHGPRQQQSGLRLDLRQTALRGGDYGVVIVPGKSSDSKLIKRLTGPDAGVQMPPTGPLAPHEIEVLRAWIDAGADMPGRALEAAASNAETPPATRAFFDAIARSDVDAVRRMLADDKTLAGAADNFGSTALMHAAADSSVSILQSLIEAGADVTARNQRSATALHWAIGDPSRVKLLLASGAPIDVKTVEGRTPLYAAATLATGTATLRLLLEAGADVNAATLVGATPLFPAVNASADMTKLLLDAGADPNRATLSGVTPLLFTRDAAVVRLLVERGADVRARSKVGETALMDVAARGDLEAARLLLVRGVDVNAVDHRGYTALILASHYEGDAAELVRLLLAHGADIAAVAEGETALSLAAKRGDSEVAKLLRAAAAARANGVRK